MCIGEAQSFCRETVEMRRGNFRRGIVRAEIAVAHVIGVEDEDVGLRRFRGGVQPGGRCEQQHGEERDIGQECFQGWNFRMWFAFKLGRIRLPVRVTESARRTMCRYISYLFGQGYEILDEVNSIHKPAVTHSFQGNRDVTYCRDKTFFALCFSF